MLFVKRRKIQNIATFVIDISLGCYSGNTAKYKKNRPGRGEKKCIFAVRIHSNSFILKHFLYWFPFLVSAYSPDFSLRLRRFLFFLFPCFGLSDPRFFPYSPEIPIFSGLFPRIRWPTPHPPPYRTWRFGVVHRIGEIRDPMPRGWGWVGQY